MYISLAGLAFSVMGELIGAIPSTLDTDGIIRDAEADTHPGTSCM